MQFEPKTQHLTPYNSIFESDATQRIIHTYTRATRHKPPLLPPHRISDSSSPKFKLYVQIELLHSNESTVVNPLWKSGSVRKTLLDTAGLYSKLDSFEMETIWRKCAVDGCCFQIFFFRLYDDFWLVEGCSVFVFGLKNVFLYIRLNVVLEFFYWIERFCVLTS